MTQEQFEDLFSNARDLMRKTKDKNHDWAHIERVLENIKRVKKELPDKLQAELDDQTLKLSAAWHDISFVFYKGGFRQFFREARRSVEIIKKYFSQEGMIEKEIDFICDIVKKHTGSSFGLLNKTDSLYHQIIQDADTIDVFHKERRRQAEKAAEQGVLFWRFVWGVYRPLTYNWYLRHYNFIYNFPEIIDKLDRENRITIQRD